MQSTMEQAEGVLAELKKLLPGKKDRVEYWPYLNGREKGFTVCNFVNEPGHSCGNYPTVSFAEYRNSDQIVLYVGTWEEMRTGISDRAYLTKTFFNEGKYKEVAKTIVKALKIEKARKVK